MQFVEVSTRQHLPEPLRVGWVYCVLEEAVMIINHGGGRIVEYGRTKDSEGLPDVGFWPISKGGTGSTTAAGARKSLGVLAATDTAEAANRLATARQLRFYGAAEGSTLFDGSGNVEVLLTHTAEEDKRYEQLANKVTTVGPANMANDTRYPSEGAVRRELDLYALKTEISQNYKGVFTTAAALKVAWPEAKAGDTATVQETNTTWAWNNAQPVGWYDTTKIIGTGIQSINGKMGEVVTLDLETDLGGIKKETVDQEIADLAATKQDNLLGFVDDALNSKAGQASVENPFVLKSELPPDLTAQLAATDLKVADNTAKTLELERVQGSARVILSNADFTRELTGDTVVDTGQLVDTQELNLAINRTLARDRKGTLALVTAINEDLVTFTTVTTSIAGEVPVLLGNVPTLGGRPTVQDQSMLVFKRNAAVGDRCRILKDERYGNATTEGYVTDISSAGAIAWGNDIEINTSDYQMQTTSQMAGMIPTCGSEPGTWGAPVNPTNFYQRWQMDLYLPKGALLEVGSAILRTKCRDSALWAGRTGEKLVILGAAHGWYSDTPAQETNPQLALAYTDYRPGDTANWVKHPDIIVLSKAPATREVTQFTTPITLNSSGLLEIDCESASPVGNVRLHLYGYIVPVPVPVR